MSARRRGATDLAGILLVDKPAGPTSHDVVAAVRRVTGEGRVGHAGTLDPMATGLLVVLIGPFARLEPYLSSATKSYEATITFGSSTDTDDAQGEIVATAAVPACLREAEHARRSLAALLGDGSQTPPAYSAIKIAGRTAYEAARAGEVLELAPRDMTISCAELLAIHEDEPVSWEVAFTVSKGTYIRAIARDLGESEGTRAHLTALRRTRSGGLCLDDARTLDAITNETAAGGTTAVPGMFADPLDALGLPLVRSDRATVVTGRRIPRAAAPDGTMDGSCVAVTVEGSLAAVYRAAPDALIPEVVLLRGDLT